MDAIDWHSSIAQSFDNGYAASRRFRERLAVWRDVMERYLPLGGTVLDAGCGPGVLSFVASTRARSVIAFDGSEEMIRIAREKVPPQNGGDIAFEVATLSEIDRFGPRSFDLVLSSSVLEYVEDLDHALCAHASMLKQGGTLLVSMPNGQSLYRWLETGVFSITGRPRYRRCVRHIPHPATFEDTLTRVGLKPIFRTTYSALPLFGSAMRAAGLQNYGDSMFLIAARQLNSEPTVKATA